MAALPLATSAAGLPGPRFQRQCEELPHPPPANSTGTAIPHLKKSCDAPKWRSKPLVIDNQPAAKFAQGFVKKGDLVAVFGQLRNREYEKDGAKQRVTEVVVDRFSGKLIGLQPKAQGPG